jgi:hypothetical protein
LCFVDSFHLRQALEGEYPKLLKLQNDLINRLNQLQPGFSEIEMDIIDEESNDSDQLVEKQKFVLIRFFLHQSFIFQNKFTIKRMF